GKVIFFISSNAGNIKSLGISNTGFTVGVNHIVGGAVIIFLKHIEVNDVFSHKSFIGHFCYHHLSIFSKDNNVIQVTTFKSKFIFLQAGAYKSFFIIYIQTSIGNGYLNGLYLFKSLNDGFALLAFTIFFQQVFIIVNGIIVQMMDVVLSFLLFHFYSLNMFISFEGIKF